MWGFPSCKDVPIYIDADFNPYCDFHVNCLSPKHHTRVAKRVDKFLVIVKDTFEKINSLKFYTDENSEETKKAPRINICMLEQELIEAIKRCYDLESLEDLKRVNNSIENIRAKIHDSKVYNSYTRREEHVELGDNLSSESKEHSVYSDSSVASPHSYRTISREEKYKLDGLPHQVKESEKRVSPKSGMFSNSLLLELPTNM